eukprot:1269967-Amphidinium_carterae.1
MLDHMLDMIRHGTMQLSLTWSSFVRSQILLKVTALDLVPSEGDRDNKLARAIPCQGLRNGITSMGNGR